MNTALEPLTGLVERVTFHNPDNGFCVLKVKVKGQRDLIALTGHASSISAGEYIQATGTWANDRTHGLQFQASFLKAMPPTTVEGIEKYLASGLIKGIGPVYAKKLTSAFGEHVFDIIENEPARLKTIEGIGRYRASQIVKGWEDQKAVREIMLFLHQHGVSTLRAVRIYKTYGANAIAAISSNPYCLARDIRGIGFMSADTIALSMGFEKTSLIRARAGLSHTLLQALEEGHCGLPKDRLLTEAETLLEIPRVILEDALDHELLSESIIASPLHETTGIYLAGLYHAERTIARLLNRKGTPPWGSLECEKAVPWVEEHLKITLAESQKNALCRALESKILIITGGPGVGKTTLMKSLLTILKAKGITIATCAPTGRAAKRLKESTGTSAKTIHRLLEIDPSKGHFTRDDKNPLDADLVVVDECSMVDVPLMHALLKALPSHAALILVGDIDQLPSVGPGQVLKDSIESGAIPVVRLTEIFRQAQSSQIIINAHRINQGIMPHLEPVQDADFYFIECSSPEEGSTLITKLIKKRIPARFKLNPLTDIQVLCPMNRGVLGTRSLNVTLQQLFHPTPSLKIERFGTTFCVGDKVMQTVNNYDKDVYNGDIGYISAIDMEAKELTLTFDGRQVLYGADEMDEITLAYATTIHKAQGSEYKAVILPITTQHYPMLQRSLLYTGLTRGKELVVIVGQKQALYLATKNQTTRARYTKLKDWLQASSKESGHSAEDDYLSFSTSALFR